MRYWSLWIIILIAIGSLVGAFFVFRSGYDAYKRDQALKEEIYKLEEEARKVSAENEILEKKITYFRTDAFTEREAKEKLNLKREEERVVEVRGIHTENLENTYKDNDRARLEVRKPVYMKWWGIFFSPYNQE